MKIVMEWQSLLLPLLFHLPSSSQQGIQGGSCDGWRTMEWLPFLLFNLPSSSQHGRMMEPPSRASMWRVGFPTPKVFKADIFPSKRKYKHLISLRTRTTTPSTAEVLECSTTTTGASAGSVATPGTLFQGEQNQVESFSR